ncbi:hypothetical protein [uncultured Cytophaga sp.]|uniref:hypothetical protein n=1 Tax=uncultured Cytophaga sp. TaxID=160238 RepID=UPI002618F127|nr:hypothetical protein [uncultured Cytophaga sp.]
MEKEDQLFESLIKEGLISTTYGIFLIANKSSTIGSIARTALMASLKAKEDASKFDLPSIVVKHDALYEVKLDGSETFIKALPKTLSQSAKTFKLK